MSSASCPWAIRAATSVLSCMQLPQKLPAAPAVTYASFMMSRSNQFLDRVPVANEPQLPLNIVQLGTRIDSQGLVEGGGQVADVHRPLLGVGADPVGRADHLAAPDAAAG